MTSGQCTIGAITKLSVCLPVESVSPSLTSRKRSVRAIGKNCAIMALIFALQTTVVSGWRCSSSSSVAAWSGSMWWITR